MRALIQRVREARVSIGERVEAQIGPGLLVFAGIAESDGDAERDWLARKIVTMRIFADDEGTMNRSVRDVGGAILAVSQFTLHASTRKGNRPSWSGAAPPEVAQPKFDALLAALAGELGKPVASGVFGADMQVTLVNDGPVTIWLDTAARD